MRSSVRSTRTAANVGETGKRCPATGWSGFILRMWLFDDKTDEFLSGPKLPEKPRTRDEACWMLADKPAPAEEEVYRMITAGIDCGAKTTKTVIMRDGHVIGRGIVPTGFEQALAVNKSLAMALNEAGITKDQLNHVGGTGSGAKAITDADVKVNDIKAIAAAAIYFFPNSRTVADVGAEEGRAAKLNAQGVVEDFAINEKCAAGAGAFIEAMARALETPLGEMGLLALTSTNPIPMNAQCAIFAESEVVGLIHAKTSKQDISRAIHDAMASRIVSIIRRIGINPDVVMVGGVAYNPGFVAALKRELNVDRIYIPEQPELAAALGAAVVAGQEAN